MGGHHGTTNAANRDNALRGHRVGNRYRRIYCSLHLAECSDQPRRRSNLPRRSRRTHGQGAAGACGEDQLTLEASLGHWHRCRSSAAGDCRSVAQARTERPLLGPRRFHTFASKFQRDIGFAGCCCPEGAFAGVACGGFGASEVWLSTMTQWLLRFSSTTVVWPWDSACWPSTTAENSHW